MQYHSIEEIKTMTKKSIEATIEERGNGFPDVGDYVPGDDGGLYKVLSFRGRIHTGNGAGTANYIHATVELADWSDCEDGEEHPAGVVLPSDDNDASVKYTVNMNDSEEPYAWMSLAGVTFDVGAQDGGRCRFTVETEDAEALEAALEADDDCLEYEAID